MSCYQPISSKINNAYDEMIHDNHLCKESSDSIKNSSYTIQCFFCYWFQSSSSMFSSIHPRLSFHVYPINNVCWTYLEMLPLCCCVDDAVEMSVGLNYSYSNGTLHHPLRVWFVQSRRKSQNKFQNENFTLV